jgi:predicted nucleic acid-binding protein
LAAETAETAAARLAPRHHAGAPFRIAATAIVHDVPIVTQDNDHDAMPDVEVIARCRGHQDPAVAAGPSPISQ